MGEGGKTRARVFLSESPSLARGGSNAQKCKALRQYGRVVGGSELSLLKNCDCSGYCRMCKALLLRLRKESHKGGGAGFCTV